MARITPAQNPRGLGSKTVLGFCCIRTPQPRNRLIVAGNPLENEHPNTVFMCRKWAETLNLLNVAPVKNFLVSL
jgi:hypothetical protein